MDNYNNQPNQYENYGNMQPQYNAQYNPQYNVQYNPYGSYAQQGNPVVAQAKSQVSLSMILGLLGSILLFIGLMMPIIDFSHFHGEVDLQYNLFKVGKNVGLISSMWNIIPYCILISIIILVALSFVKIPILKILPVLLILAMFVIMLVDMGNVVQWIKELLDKLGIVLETEVTTEEIFKSFMAGLYLMITGTIIATISCFVKR